MSSTALIIRPHDAPRIQVLECDGPIGFVPVNRYPGEYSGKRWLSFEDFTALPDHAKFPGPSLAEIEFSSAQRIHRLVEVAETRGGWMCPEHLQEIRGRLKVLFPFCDQEL